MSFHVEFTAQSASDAASILKEERNHQNVPASILDFLDAAVNTLVSNGHEGLVHVETSGHLHHPEHGGSGASWINTLKVSPVLVRKPLNLPAEPIAVIPRPAVAEVYQPTEPAQSFAETLASEMKAGTANFISPSNAAQVAASEEIVDATPSALPPSAESQEE